MTAPLISPAELTAQLEDTHPPVVLDVRFRLDKPNGLDDYSAGHIPGAVYADLETQLSAHGEPHEGRHPLPTGHDLQVALRGWGISDGDSVVVYDGGSTLAAGRAWWMLRNAGVPVRVLNGGWPAWVSAGYPVESGITEPGRGSITLRRNGTGITIDEAAGWPEHGVLIDVRAAERYRGETEPLDPVAGHIPGAVNLPSAAFFNRDGTFRSADEIAEAFNSVGAGPDVAVATYCGSGVTAAQAALAAAVAGREIDVFVGSWSAWSNTPGRPVATGND